MTHSDAVAILAETLGQIRPYPTRAMRALGVLADDAPRRVIDAPMADYIDDDDGAQFAAAHNSTPARRAAREIEHDIRATVTEILGALLK